MTLVGAAVTPKTGQTWVQAIAEFETLTDRPAPVRRCYDGTPPSSIQGGQLKSDVGVRKSVYSLKATMSTPISTLEALAADIENAGHPVDLIPYHEPVDNMAGDAFIALYQRTAAPFRAAGIPVGPCFTNWSINLPYSDSQSALAHYWPGDDWVDFLAIDEYPRNEITSTKDATPMELRARRACQFADARGIPLGLAEYGVDISWDVKKSDNWLRSVTDWAQMRAALGRPLRWMCYFSVYDPNAAPPNNYLLSNKQEYVDSYIDSYRILAS
jgi:hypothetical protein